MSLLTRGGIAMIESETITMTMELSYYNVGELLYGQAYYVWNSADPNKRIIIWEEILKLAEEFDRLPDLGQICEIVEKY